MGNHEVRWLPTNPLNFPAGATTLHSRRGKRINLFAPWCKLFAKKLRPQLPLQEVEAVLDEFDRSSIDRRQVREVTDVLADVLDSVVRFSDNRRLVGNADTSSVTRLFEDFVQPAGNRLGIGGLVSEENRDVVFGLVVFGQFHPPVSDECDVPGSHFSRDETTLFVGLASGVIREHFDDGLDSVRRGE